MNIKHNQFRNMGIALVGIWFAVVTYAYLMGISGVLTIRDYIFQPWQQIAGTTLYVWLPWLFLTPSAFYFSNKAPVLPNNWLSSLIKHLFFMLFLILCHGYLAARLYYHIGLMDDDMATYQAWQHTGHFLFDDGVFFVDAFIYTVLITSQNLKNFFRLIQNNEINTMLMQKKLAEAELKSLKMQINPHFLFNTLNSISVLIKKQEIETADTMINRLSNFFRQTLQQGKQQFITLKQELSLIQDYLDIEKLRFGDRLKVKVHIKTESYKQMVPTLILQPLVENSIKHGLSQKTGPCYLSITVEKTPLTLKIMIKDNGIGVNATVQRNTGLGLQNVQARMQACYSDNHRFSFNSSLEGTEVSLIIPLSESVS